jgi:predicted transposase YdaD
VSNKYKDSLFRSIFNNEKAALELYNAMHNTHYDEHTEIVINTLHETLWTGQKNDVSFLINGKLVVLAEHQSTVNWNMPFRFLQPLARLFENSIPDKHAVYRQGRIKLPRPEFAVFYNGTDPFPEVSSMRLSDAFERVEGFEEARLELLVTVYNINERNNWAMMERSEHIRGYAFFVSRMRRYEAEERQRGTPAHEITLIALRKTIADCKDAKLLSSFWENLTMEDMRMMCTEWDWNTALAVRAEEAKEEGKQEGRLEVAKNLISLGLSIEQIAKAAELDIVKVKELIQ